MSLMISNKTKMSEIIKENFMTLFILKKYGMLCADCPAKNNDSIEECAKTHHVDLNVLIADLNKFVK